MKRCTRACVGGGRYLQKVVSAATTNERATEWRREVKECTWCVVGTRPVGNSFSTGRPRKCGENVAAASVAEIYYSVTLQAHSREKEKERQTQLTQRETRSRCFLRVNSTTRVTAYFKYGFARSSSDFSTILRWTKKKGTKLLRGKNKTLLCIRLFSYTYRALFRDVTPTCQRARIVMSSFFPRRAFLNFSLTPWSASLPFQVQ